MSTKSGGGQKVERIKSIYQYKTKHHPLTHVCKHTRTQAHTHTSTHAHKHKSITHSHAHTCIHLHTHSHNGNQSKLGYKIIMHTQTHIERERKGSIKQSSETIGQLYSSSTHQSKATRRGQLSHPITIKSYSLWAEFSSARLLQAQPEGGI